MGIMGTSIGVVYISRNSHVEICWVGDSTSFQLLHEHVT